MIRHFGIAQLNAYESQIVKASQQIGTVGGTAMYQAGTAVTNGLAGGPPNMCWTTAQ